MKIVKFRDGTYGVRKLSLLELLFGHIYVFKDLTDRCWWNVGTLPVIFNDCKGTFEQCVNAISKNKDTGIPINLKYELDWYRKK